MSKKRQYELFLDTYPNTAPMQHPYFCIPAVLRKTFPKKTKIFLYKIENEKLKFTRTINIINFTTIPTDLTMYIFHTLFTYNSLKTTNNFYIKTTNFDNFINEIYLTNSNNNFPNNISNTYLSNLNQIDGFKQENPFSYDYDTYNNNSINNKWLVLDVMDKLFENPNLVINMYSSLWQEFRNTDSISNNFFIHKDLIGLEFFFVNKDIQFEPEYETVAVFGLHYCSNKSIFFNNAYKWKYFSSLNYFKEQYNRNNNEIQLLNSYVTDYYFSCVKQEQKLILHFH